MRYPLFITRLRRVQAIAMLWPHRSCVRVRCCGRFGLGGALAAGRRLGVQCCGLIGSGAPWRCCGL